MENYKQAVELATTLLAQNEAYTKKPTKAESARIRKTLNELKKVVTEAKRDLLDADKK